MRYTPLFPGDDRRTARERIADRVAGVSRRRSGDDVGYASPPSHRLAESTDATLLDGRAGSRPRYRTTPSPTATHVGPHTQERRGAVERFRVRGDGRER